MNWTKFNKFLYKYWKQQTIVIVIGLCVSPISLINPYLTKLVIDKAYGNKDLKLFFILSCIGASVFLFRGLIDLISGYLGRWINKRVFFDMQMHMFEYMQKLPMSFYDNHSTGEYIYRINSDVRAMCDFVCNIIPQVITFVPRLIFILVIVFVMNWKLALLVALLVPITYIHPYFFGKKIRDVSRKNIQKTQSIFKELQEVFTHMRLIKALGTQDNEIVKYYENLSKRLSLELKQERISQVSGLFASILNKIVMGVITLYGGYQVIKGEFTLGGLTATMIYLTQFTGVLKSVGTVYQKIIVNSVISDRLSEIFDLKTIKDDSSNAHDAPNITATIEFRDVSFGYEKESPVLDGVNFSIGPGECAAFVGLSGCGKTTAIALLLKLYKPDKGNIFIDGMPINKIKEKAFRGYVRAALQKPFLWNDTIGNNISYGIDNVSLHDIKSISKVTCAQKFIEDLPDKYDSVIGESACKLSQGQKQRLAAARAVIGKPKILILDEALSSLDSQTEDKAVSNIFAMLENTTIIMVSHRLSVVKKSDRVYFFKDSKTVISGTHDELLKKYPEYSNLFASQL
ncbi:MAG: ABC transporter ATP-binding protein [Candidatus Omnitrophica bacterium]|nr:ABC transporter ATP-binding protein [Candidatus Omnitrophota bacterium]MDD5081387.1 ABC transporter ATP-binding protein [Candidatus Omnitrophota bacterium]MDD5440754.1 ABC transporter ATP-binding protein [Candidatus Omnitrophota bacterium]